MWSIQKELPEHEDVPGPVEALEDDHDDGQTDGGHKQQLRDPVQLLVDQANLNSIAFFLHSIFLHYSLVKLYF